VIKLFLFVSVNTSVKDKTYHYISGIVRSELVRVLNKVKYS
jgi:hypothetical protein